MKRANIIWQYEKQSVNVTPHSHTFVHPIKETFLWPQKLKKLLEKVKKKKKDFHSMCHISPFGGRGGKKSSFKMLRQDRVVI